MARKRNTHFFKIKTVFEGGVTERDAHRKIKSWLEHHAHDAPSFGFELDTLEATDEIEAA